MNVEPNQIREVISRLMIVYTRAKTLEAYVQLPVGTRLLVVSVDERMPIPPDDSAPDVPQLGAPVWSHVVLTDGRSAWLLTNILERGSAPLPARITP